MYRCEDMNSVQWISLCTSMPTGIAVCKCVGYGLDEWDFFMLVSHLNNFLFHNSVGYLGFGEQKVKHTHTQKENWIKRDQLDVTCFIISLFNAQHVSDVNTSILKSLRLICWVISWVVLLWYELRCGLAGVVYPDAGWSTTPAKPKCNTNTPRTRAIQPMK